MATNTTVLILVTAMAALVLTGALALVVYKTRNQQRHGKGETIRDQVEEDALRLRRQEVKCLQTGSILPPRSHPECPGSLDDGRSLTIDSPGS